MALTADDVTLLLDALARLETLLAVDACASVALIGVILGVASGKFLGGVLYDILAS